MQLVQSRIPGIDGLRGMAVLMIVIFHYVTTAINPEGDLFVNTLFRLTHYFNSGVDLFFIISGFLITRNLIVKKISWEAIKGYLFKRGRRILPLYYMGLALCALLFLSNMGSQTVWYYSGEIPWYSYVFFFQNECMAWHGSLGSRLLSVYWSLGIEIQFYLLMPLILFLFKANGRIVFCIATIVLAVVFRLWDTTWIGSYTHFYCRMDALFSGVLLALLSANNQFMNLLKDKTRLIEISALLLFLFAVGLSLNVIAFPSHFIPSFFILFYSALLILQLSPNSFLSEFSNHGILRFLGKYSYGMYIMHEIVRFAIFQFVASRLPGLSGFSDIIYTTLSFGLTIVISVVVYHQIEMKFLSVKY